MVYLKFLLGSLLLTWSGVASVALPKAIRVFQPDSVAVPLILAAAGISTSIWITGRIMWALRGLKDQVERGSEQIGELQHRLEKLEERR